VSRIVDQDGRRSSKSEGEAGGKQVEGGGKGERERKAADH